MAGFLKNLWQGWKKFALKIAAVQTYVLMTLMYGLVVPFFSLIRFQDPLRLRQKTDRSFWIPRKKTENSLEETQRQF